MQIQVFFMCCVSYVSYVWYVWMVLILCSIFKPLNIPLFQPLSATLAAPSRPWQRDRRMWAPWRKPPSAATRVPDQPMLWIPYHAYIYTIYIYIYDIYIYDIYIWYIYILHIICIYIYVIIYVYYIHIWSCMHVSWYFIYYITHL